MGIQVQVRGLDELRRKGGRFERDVRESVVDQIHRDVRGMQIGMLAKAGGLGGVQRRAASTVRTTFYRNGAQIAGGGGRSLGALLFKGAEFGGRKRRRTHIGRRGDTFYVIKRRRTTMMFYPHAGRVGYFYFPTIRSDLRGIDRRVLRAMGEGARK